jgi:hypothetical protein
LVEHTENDSYWADGGDSSGKNMLGKILMEVRDVLNKRAEFFQDPMYNSDPVVEYKNKYNLYRFE